MDNSAKKLQETSCWQVMVQIYPCHSKKARVTLAGQEQHTRLDYIPASVGSVDLFPTTIHSISTTFPPIQFPGTSRVFPRTVFKMIKPFFTVQARKKRPASHSQADEDEEEEALQDTDEDDLPEEESMDEDDEDAKHNAGLPTPASKRPRLMQQHNYGASTFASAGALDPEVRIKPEREEKATATAAKSGRKQKLHVRTDGPFLPTPVSWFERSPETDAAAAAAAADTASATPVAVLAPRQPWMSALDSPLCAAVALACQNTLTLHGIPWMVIAAIPWVTISQGLCMATQGAARPAWALSPLQCKLRFEHLLKVFYVKDKVLPAGVLAVDVGQRLRSIVQRNREEEAAKGTSEVRQGVKGFGRQ